MSPFKIGNDYLRLLVERGLIPEHASSVQIWIEEGSIPEMTVKSFLEDKDMQFIIDCIESTHEIVPPPPRPKVYKPPATESRGI